MFKEKIKYFFLICGDVISLYLSLYLTLQIRYLENFNADIYLKHFLPFTIIYFFCILILYIFGFYETRNNFGLEYYSTLPLVIIINTVIGVIAFYFVPYFGITPKTNLVVDIIIFTILFVLWRYFYNRLLTSKAWQINVLTIGKENDFQKLKEEIKNKPQLGYKIIGPVKENEIKTPSDLSEIIVQNDINLIVTSISPHKNPRLTKNLYQCLPLKINFSDLASFYEKTTGKIPVSVIGEIWFLENLMKEEKKFYNLGKRILDIIGALILGLAFLLLSPIIAFAIKWESEGPVFYKQQRVGKNGQIFWITKFRSMVKNAEKNGVQWAQKEDKRITKVGHLLRRLHLDEMPQFWNIIKGEMSFVGPRPERPEFVSELEKIIPFYPVRHIIKPGLSGWAQINFKKGNSIADAMEKLQYELYYLKNRSLILDVSIILKTLAIIIKGQKQ